MKICVGVCKENCEKCEPFCKKSVEEGLVAVKKRVSKHYVPPDMLALKMLTSSSSDDLEKLSDDELLNLKTKILQDIKKELSNEKN